MELEKGTGKLAWDTALYYSKHFILIIASGYAATWYLGLMFSKMELFHAI
jgi:hypothetical protein